MHKTVVHFLNENPLKTYNSVCAIFEFSYFKSNEATVIIRKDFKSLLDSLSKFHSNSSKLQSFQHQIFFLEIYRRIDKLNFV